MRFVCDACMFAGLNATPQGHLGSADKKEPSGYSCGAGSFGSHPLLSLGFG